MPQESWSGGIFLIMAKFIFVFLPSDIWLALRPHKLQKAGA